MVSNGKQYSFLLRKGLETIHWVWQYGDLSEVLSKSQLVWVWTEL